MATEVLCILAKARLSSLPVPPVREAMTRELTLRNHSRCKMPAQGPA
jgi:hypothetical protein